MLTEPSATMQAVCLVRATNSELLGEDPVSSDMVSKLPKAQEYREQLDKFSKGMFTRSVLIRTLFFYEALKSCADSYGQLVLLSSGLNFSFLRSIAWKEKPVFIIDHPLSLHLVESLVDFKTPLFSNVRRLSVDFENMTDEELSSSLNGQGFDSSIPTLFLWEGATFYMKHTTVEKCLAVVSRLAERNKLVVDFANQDSWRYKQSVSQQPDEGAQQSLALLKKINEPWLGFFSKARVRSLITELGYANTELLDDADLENRYLGSSQMGHQSMFYMSATR